MTSIGLWKLAASVLLILGVDVSAASAALSLTGEPIPVTEGNLLTLSCSRITNDAPPLIGVAWYRNTEAIFQTVHGRVFPSNSSEYNDVSGRISVTTNQQIHKVMLQINSILDDGFVWRCSVEDYDSNNLTIVIDAVLVDTTTTNESFGGISIASTSTTIASMSPQRCRDSGTELVLMVIGFGGWGVTIILAVAILWCRVRSSKRQTTNTSKSDPIHSVLVRETSGSDVNNEYASSQMIHGASGSDVINEYVSPKVITETAHSDVHYEYTSIDVVTETSGSDISHGYTSSEVMSDGTGTNGSDLHNKFVIPRMIAETTDSDEHYECTTGGAQCDEDGQYTDMYTLDRPLYTDKDKEDSPYLQPAADELQTDTAEYITATFDCTDTSPVTNK